ncbi:hypothetical protein EV193_102333 [Herbihabitans rhizosphaerae]|uniref:Peptidoglycan binding protein n=1 Tax=Herbihabitans rhizosphaerae TaxID=1872711 RepID=A0A4Q7L2I4_9PSEU|nr:peptidoglycan-binding protein [Herbihabitans rhizosphaerae]RZS43354.1 hypothetical protein EV193_102333 [Herbihabitans rhizosphaerae]
MSTSKLGALRILLPVALVVGVITAGATAATGAPDQANAAPAVDMERVVVQAHVEPTLGQTDLPGDDSVKVVQEALKAKGHETKVDGWFGSETRGAYSAWQKSLGHSGNGANGIPGPGSLAKLGEGRFTIDRKIDVGGQTTHDGHTVNKRTSDMLTEADGKLSWGIDVTQGSYRPCSGASSCTHNGGGAVDIAAESLSTTQRWETVKALRQVGFAAWLRTPDQANWPYHIHAIAVADTDVHVEAAAQVADYHAGRNGLASHAPDNTPQEYRVPFTWWEQYKRG